MKQFDDLRAFAQLRDQLRAYWIDDLRAYANIGDSASSGATLADIDAAIAAHRLEVDPHSTYLTLTEADALFLTPSDASGLYYSKALLDAGALDTRYYTKSESEGRYVNVTGDTMTGQLTINPGSALAPLVLGVNAQGMLVGGLNADMLDGYDSAAFPRKAENASVSGSWTFAVDLAFASGAQVDFADVAEDKVYWYSNTYGTGIEASTLTHWSGVNHRWRIGGTSASTGTQEMILNSTGLQIGATSGTASAALDVTGNAVISGSGTAATLVATTSVTTPSLTSAAALAITSAAGNISLDASTDVIAIRASNTLKSENYASQTTGWGIDYAGSADFRYLFTDELHAKSFIADLEQALAGGQIISKSVAILAVDFTAPAAGSTATLRVKDLPSAANMAVFQSGDIVRLRTFSRASGSLTIGNCWGVVTSYVDQSDGTQAWTFTRSSSTNAGSITAGTIINADSIVLDYGTSGNGFYEVNAIDGTYAANSPYWQISSWSTHPATGTTVNVRGGKLTGIFSVANEYGLFAGTGSTASDSYIRIGSYTQESNNLSMSWKSGGVELIAVNPSTGIGLQTYDASSSVIGWGDQRIISWNQTVGSGTPDGALWAQSTTTNNEVYLQANLVGGREGYIDLTAWGSGNASIYMTGGTASNATIDMYAHDLLIDLGSGTSGTGIFAAYVNQLRLNDLTTGGADGSAASPLISFVEDTDTGFYRSAANQLDISTGGTSRVTINNTSLSVHQNTDNPSYVGYARVGYIGHAGYAGFAHASSATSSAYALIQHSTGETYLNAATTKRIHFRNNNTEVMNMSDVGLRIGDSTTPTEALEVAGTIYASNRLVAGGADLSSNVSKFTGRYSTASGISLTATSWGYASAVLFNAYQSDTSVRLSVSGGCKYLGAQYTGNVTAPGMFYYDANSNRFEWWIGEQGLANGANITAWAEQLRLDSAGKLTLFGDLEWSSGGFAAGWTALTYNTGWASYGSPYKAMSYCRIGDLVMVNGLVLRSSGTNVIIGTLPSGYRPATNKIFNTMIKVDTIEGYHRLEVDTSGNITLSSITGTTVNWVSLDCIQFRTNS